MGSCARSAKQTNSSIGVYMSRILSDEIANDPLSKGYSTMTDAQLLTSLNTKNISRNRTSMTGREVKAGVDIPEYKALAATKKQQLIELTNSDDLDLFGADKDILLDIFGAGSTTASNLAAARVESISRGVEIGWGEVTVKDFRLHTLTRKFPA